MIEIASAISSFKSCVDLINVAVNARDDKKLQDALAGADRQYSAAIDSILSLQSRLLQAQEKISTLQEAIVQANDALRDATMKASDRAQYKLVNLCSGGDHFHAYQHQPPEGPQSDQLHYLCQPCYDKEVKSVLQMFQAEYGTTHLCPTCKTSIVI